MSDSGTSESTAATVLFLSGDLMFASRVKAAAENAGLDFQLASNLPEAGSRIDWVIVDLSSRSGVVDGLLDRCSTLCPQATVMAYGPHVQTGRIQKAREAGIENVMTRGQFDRALPTLFVRS